MTAKNEAVRDLMTIMDSRQRMEDSMKVVCGRFKEAIRKANPSISPDKLDGYDSEFLQALPSLHAEMVGRLEQDLGAALTDHDLNILSKISEVADVDTLSEVVRKYMSISENMEAVVRPVMIAAHTRTSQKVFNTF